MFGLWPFRRLVHRGGRSEQRTGRTCAEVSSYQKQRCYLPDYITLYCGGPLDAGKLPGTPVLRLHVWMEQVYRLMKRLVDPSCLQLLLVMVCVMA